MGKRTTPHEDQLALVLDTKWCARCERDLPTWDFTKNKARKDGLTTYCRLCWNGYIAGYAASTPGFREKAKQRAKAHYAQNVEWYSATHKAYRLANLERLRECGKRWEAENRDHIRRRKNAHRRSNPEKHRQRQNAWRLANAERVRAQRAAWKAANRELIRAQDRAWVIANRDKHNAKGARRRARMANVQLVDFTPTELAQRWAYYGNKCWICRSAPATATDHVKPISKGGSHMLCNLRPVCRPCNSAKRDKWPYSVDLVCSA